MRIEESQLNKLAKALESERMVTTIWLCSSGMRVPTMLLALTRGRLFVRTVDSVSNRRCGSLEKWPKISESLGIKL